jgi:hypothetical protein
MVHRELIIYKVRMQELYSRFRCDFYRIVRANQIKAFTTFYSYQPICLTFLEFSEHREQVEEI